MDSRIWTVGATLFTLLYLTLAIFLLWATVIVALVLCAWLMAKETEGAEGLKYVEMELRPALAFLGIFCLAVVLMGPVSGGYIPPLWNGSDLFAVGYGGYLAVLHAHPIWFFFPLLPLFTGSAMGAYQAAHPTVAISATLQPVTSTTKVHVHLHKARRRAKKDEEDDDDSDSDDSDDGAAAPVAALTRGGSLATRRARATSADL